MTSQRPTRTKEVDSRNPSPWKANGQQFTEDDDKITRIERTTTIGDLNRGDVKKTKGGMRTLS
ncbi:hypothetical protein Tco_1390569, partial [Tanacetum coccineum]